MTADKSVPTLREAAGALVERYKEHSTPTPFDGSWLESREWAALIEALAQPEAQPSVPVGFALVPVVDLKRVTILYRESKTGRDEEMRRWAERLAAAPQVEPAADIASVKNLRHRVDPDSGNIVGYFAAPQPAPSDRESLAFQYRREQVARIMTPIYDAFGKPPAPAGKTEREAQPAALFNGWAFHQLGEDIYVKPPSGFGLVVSTRSSFKSETLLHGLARSALSAAQEQETGRLK